MLTSFFCLTFMSTNAILVAIVFELHFLELDGKEESDGLITN